MFEKLLELTAVTKKEFQEKHPFSNDPIILYVSSELGAQIRKLGLTGDFGNGDKNDLGYFNGVEIRTYEMY